MATFYGSKFVPSEDVNVNYSNYGTVIPLFLGNKINRVYSHGKNRHNVPLVFHFCRNMNDMLVLVIFNQSMQTVFYCAITSKMYEGNTVQTQLAFKVCVVARFFKDSANSYITQKERKATKLLRCLHDPSVGEELG